MPEFACQQSRTQLHSALSVLQLSCVCPFTPPTQSCLCLCLYHCVFPPARQCASGEDLSHQLLERRSTRSPLLGGALQLQETFEGHSSFFDVNTEVVSCSCRLAPLDVSHLSTRPAGATSPVRKIRIIMFGTRGRASPSPKFDYVVSLNRFHNIARKAQACHGKSAVPLSTVRCQGHHFSVKLLRVNGLLQVGALCERPIWPRPPNTGGCAIFVNAGGGSNLATGRSQ